MTCNQCKRTVHTAEHEAIEDHFHLPEGLCLCLPCAIQNHGEEEYMRSHSYDVDVPFAENH